MNSSRKNPRRVGILGGMGPAAAIDLQAKILAATPAARDAEHVPIVVWNVPQVPDRVAAVLGEGPSPLPAMIEGARALEASGCEAIAVACNTAHHWAGELGASVRIPLLHIADATAAEVKALGLRRVGLLGTRFTMEQDFYRERLRGRHGIEVIVPPAEDREIVHRVIYDELCLGRTLEESRSAYRRIMQGLVDAGAQGIVLACTEIPMLVGPEDATVPVFDTTAIHTRAAAERSAIPLFAPIDFYFT